MSNHLRGYSTTQVVARALRARTLTLACACGVAAVGAGIAALNAMVGAAAAQAASAVVAIDSDDIGGVVVAHQRQYAAVFGGTGEIGVAEHVAGAVDARPLAQPRGGIADPVPS